MMEFREEPLEHIGQGYQRNPIKGDEVLVKGSVKGAAGRSSNRTER
jgi:hypothetical protein